MSSHGTIPVNPFFVQSQHLLPPVTRNRAGDEVKRGKKHGSGGSTPYRSDQLWYCGKMKNECLCKTCDGRCGPGNGCPCKDCYNLIGTDHGMKYPWMEKRSSHCSGADSQCTDCEEEEPHWKRRSLFPRCDHLHGRRAWRNPSKTYYGKEKL